MAQDDVANKAIEANVQKYAGITCNALPTGRFTTKSETYPVPDAFSPSGLNQRYTDRFMETH